MRNCVKTVLSTLVLSTLIVGCSKSSSNSGGGESPTPITDRDVQTFVTTADNTMHFDKIGRDFIEGPNMSPEITVTLNPNERYQDFDGFGAAITGATAYNLKQMSADNRRKFLKETFSVADGMGYSYVRVPIGGSDFNARSNYDYTCCDMQGIENFSLTTEETDYIIPILKEILEINPDLKVMGSPWSCPRWMKVNNLNDLQPYNSWTGGHLNPYYYEDYATYFVKWIQAFEQEGIHITSVTLENEPLNPGNCISLLMYWNEARDFVKVLSPAFLTAGLDTKIIVFDHNYNYDGKEDQEDYPLKVYADATAASFVDGAAYHNYRGSFSELAQIHQSAPNKNLYFTEASIGTWNGGHDMSTSLPDQVKNTALGNVMNWCKAVIVWNLVLDKDGGPHGGAGACTTCYGAVDLGSDYTVAYRNSHYYAIGHLSKAFKAGSTRIGTKGYKPTNVTICAAENPDGTYGVVLYNDNNNGVSFQLEGGGHYFAITLPAKSVTSCLWSKD